MGYRSSYIVTALDPGESEPRENPEPCVTGDPAEDADDLIAEYERRGKEVLHIRWANGAGTIYAARGIDP